MDTYVVSYLKKDGYLEASTAGSSSNSERLPASDVSDYDALGDLTPVEYRLHHYSEPLV